MFNIPKAKRNYYILIIAVMSMWITVSTIYMVLPIYFQNHGVSKSGNGILIAIGTFAGVISSIIAGKYSDTHGRKPVLLTGVGLYSIVFFLFAYLGRDFNSFFVLRFIEGFGFYMVPVAITTIAGDIFPQQERGKAMGVYSMSAGVGQLVGPLFAGRFIDSSSFFTYFIISGVLVAVSWVVILLFVDETLEKSKQTLNREKQGGVKGFINNIRNLGITVAIFFIAVLVYRVGLTMINPFFSLYLNEELGIDMTRMGYFFAVRALVTLILSPIAGSLADRFGRKPVFISGLVLLSGTLMGYYYASAFQHIIIIRILQSISNSILQPSSRAYITDLLSEENRGFGLGFYTTLLSEGSTMGAIVGGWIAGAYNFRSLFLVGTASTIVGAIIVLFKVPEPMEHIDTT
ncbi:MFS transporter [Candidatus Bathyarchaeota archaeon]|nr:MFS transporter [Candidatus Bathyarchaeota archaeon]